MAPSLASLWRRFIAFFSRRRRLVAANDPAPGTRAFLRHPHDERTVSDPRADAWIAHLRAELPFPQPLFGAIEAPVNARDVHERMNALDAQIADEVARAIDGRGSIVDGEPAWFLTLADRFLPLAAWYAGVGLPSGAPELPDRLRDLTDRARRIPGINRALEWLGEQVEQLTRQNAGAQAAWFTLLKVHIEAMLRPLAVGESTASVEFDFPAPGTRVTDLVPTPAPGSATSGHVARVLCPAVSVRLQSNAGEVLLQRGAHVRAR